MTNSPGLVSESCHESTFKLIRHHNFNDVLFSVGATGACYDFYFFSRVLLKTTREESKMSNFHTTLFQNSFVLVS